MIDCDDHEYAFDAPAGSVWHYVFVANAYLGDETIFMILPGRKAIDHETNHQTTFREYLNLMTGELNWFAAGSPLNRRARRMG